MLMKLDKVTCVKYRSSFEMGAYDEIVGHDVIGVIVTVGFHLLSVSHFFLCITLLIGGHLQWQ